MLRALSAAEPEVFSPSAFPAPPTPKVVVQARVISWTAETPLSHCLLWNRVSSLRSHILSVGVRSVERNFCHTLSWDIQSFEIVQPSNMASQEERVASLFVSTIVFQTPSDFWYWPKAMYVRMKRLNTGTVTKADLMFGAFVSADRLKGGGPEVEGALLLRSCAHDRSTGSVSRTLSAWSRRWRRRASLPNGEFE